MTSINVRKIELAVREILKEILQEAHVPTKVGMPTPQLPVKKSKTKTKVGYALPNIEPSPTTSEPPPSPEPSEPRQYERPLSRDDRIARDAAQSAEPPTLDAGEENEEENEEEEEEGMPGYKQASGDKFFEGKSTNEK